MAHEMAPEKLVADFPAAIESGRIFPHYQPQYNHATGRMIGAEALMRWEHSEGGRQTPDEFIPALEEAGLIVQADLFLFEQICRFHHRRLRERKRTVPISFNISRHDLADGGYLDSLEEIRKKYDVPVDLLRAEITETSAIGGRDLVTSSLERLHGLGYVVEMDDFGSGYSSLNILKDLPFDIIKLDMGFLRGGTEGRGGIILNAVVQMVKWLEMPAIAEGVETWEQADFMKSIGCTYIQGYLYARPLDESEFCQCLERDGLEPTVPALELIDTMHAKQFWDPTSLETLIFTSATMSEPLHCSRTRKGRSISSA